MRWHETTSRILLILCVANFALAAPVAVRDIHEVRLDMTDVAKGGTDASQSQTRKRWDPWTQLSTTNAADRTSTPPSPSDSEDPDHWFAQSPPASPAMSVASNSAPPTPATSESAPPSSGSPSGSRGGASPEYRTSHSHGDPLWDSDRFTLSEQWLVDDPDNPVSPKSVNGPPPTPPPSSPAPSKGPPPSKDDRPPPSPGPDVNPPPSSELQHPAEHESESFLEKLLKGKVRRHISDPVDVYATQSALQDTVNPTTYVTASLRRLPTQLTRGTNIIITLWSCLVSRDFSKNLDSLATSVTSGIVGNGAGMSLHGLPYRLQSQRES